MTTHKQLKGNRITTSINMHSRTHDILKYIKTSRSESGLMGIFEKMFSTNKGIRNEAMRWLTNFHQNVLPSSFIFSDKGHWEFILSEVPDPDYPVIADKDKGIYEFDDDGGIVFKE